MYGSALGGYSRAAALNPDWEEPVEKEKQLLEYLRKVTELLQNKVGEVTAQVHTISVLSTNIILCKNCTPWQEV